MGEVYRARDTRLDRDVALKVLPETFTAEPERLARFQREAKVLASLNHPNIAAIHGLEDADPSTGSGQAVRALVLELVDGPTLADRIAQGPIPLDEALPIARQMAEALEAAHEAGVIHRDLKPANIKVRADGTVKVLDFGLAKLSEPSGSSAVAQGFSPAGGLSQSPTITSPAAMTMQGVILGTAAYMSPEQARGRPVDKRADIWAFGCVLYEMLTGRRAFAGDDVTDTLASVVRQEPSWEALPADVPPRLVALLRRCFEKQPRERLRDIGDARHEIAAPRSGPPAVPPDVERSRSQWVPWIATGVLALSLAAGWALVMRTRSAPETPAWSAGPIRFTIPLPDGVALSGAVSNVPLAISPDGRRIVFVGISRDGLRQLWLHSLEAELAQPVAGTDGATAPFWSPDSRWIGFFADGRLKKVPVFGGPPQTLASTVLGSAGAAWGTDVIIFSADVESGLSRVLADGGPVSKATTLDPERDENSHLWPQFLSDGRHFVYGANARDSFSIFLGAVDGTAPRLLAQREFSRRSTLGYVPGYVLFVEDAALFARPFDEERLVFSGEAVRLLDGVPVSGRGRAPFSVSSNGVLAYSPTPVGDLSVLEWFSRDGTRTGAVAAPARYSGFGLAPDTGRIVFSRFDERGARDVWVRDLYRGSESKLTFDGDSMTRSGRQTASASRSPLRVTTRRISSPDPRVAAGSMKSARVRRSRIIRRAGAPMAC